MFLAVAGGIDVETTEKHQGGVEANGEPVETESRCTVGFLVCSFSFHERLCVTVSDDGFSWVS